MGVAVVAAGLQLAGGLFDSEGPDAKRYAERKFNLEALKNLAAGGNVAAWHYLGALGKVAPLPSNGLVVDGLKGGYGHAGKGWISSMGDVGYADLIAGAKQAYYQLAPKMALSGVSAAAAITPPADINPVTISTKAPSSGSLDFASMGTGGTIVVVLALLVVLYLALK